MKAIFQRKLSRFEVQVIWSNNRHKIHSLVFRKQFFFGDHFGVATVNACRIEEKILSCYSGFLRITAEGSTNNFDLTVKVSGHAMNRSDESTWAATDHSHLNFF